jgi:hypothetical protein
MATLFARDVGLGSIATFRLLPATSGLPRTTDFMRPARHVGKVPILLQKSFWGAERRFLEPLMRFPRGDLRDHIVSIQNRSRTSQWR